MCAGPLTQCVRRTGLQGPFSCGDQDSADTEAFLSPFRRKYCPIVQTRILRLRETMSQGILSPEGEDQNVAQPWAWLWGLALVSRACVWHLNTDLTEMRWVVGRGSARREEARF